MITPILFLIIFIGSVIWFIDTHYEADSFKGKIQEWWKESEDDR